MTGDNTITIREITDLTGMNNNDVSAALCQTKIVASDGKKVYRRDEAVVDLKKYMRKKIDYYGEFVRRWEARLNAVKRL